MNKTLPQFRRRYDRDDASDVLRFAGVCHNDDALQGKGELRTVLAICRRAALDSCRSLKRRKPRGRRGSSRPIEIETADHHLNMREFARQDYVLAYPGEPVARVHREMMLKNVENVVVVESQNSRKPIGIARANDLLQLRRWLMEEDTREVVGVEDTMSP